MGQVQDDAFPEPYLGDLFGHPKGVFLALNPGGAVPKFQSRTGIFADKIRQLGSYRTWATTWPYLQDQSEWDRTKGRNKHHRSRMTFLRRWMRDQSLSGKDRVDFELYPFHSRSVQGKINPDKDIITEFIWKPIAELNPQYVFAFSAWWVKNLPGLGCDVIERLGDGGRPYKTSAKGRAVLVAKTPEGITVIAEKHSGSATPPSEEETRALREKVDEILGTRR